MLYSVFNVRDQKLIKSFLEYIFIYRRQSKVVQLNIVFSVNVNENEEALIKLLRMNSHNLLKSLLISLRS